MRRVARRQRPSSATWEELFNPTKPITQRLRWMKAPRRCEVGWSVIAQPRAQGRQQFSHPLLVVGHQRGRGSALPPRTRPAAAATTALSPSTGARRGERTC